MLNLLISPGRYVSGYENIAELGTEVNKIADSVVVLLDETVEGIVEKGIKSLEEKIIIHKVYFNGECCHEEMDRVAEIAKENKVDAVVGFGGGKIMDTTKGAGYKAGVKIVTVPTIAATCASWASHSAVYTKEGIAYEYFDIHKNADLLFMDKKIISEAPKRYLISGMVDTLAKWIETNAYTKGKNNFNVELEIARHLAKKCFDEVIEFGKKAITDIEAGEYSEEVDRMIEHVILTAGLVGGIGGEACRAVAAHAINNGYTVLAHYKKMLHGEVVGFGNIVQLLLDSEYELAEKVLNFYKDICAPIGQNGLGLNPSDEEMIKVINKSMYSGDTMWNLPYEFDFELIENKIKEADELCKKYQ